PRPPPPPYPLPPTRRPSALALVEIRPRRAAAGRRHPVGKPLEAQDLGIAAHAAAAHLQQNPLGLVGKLLRHQENLSHLPGFHGLDRKSTRLNSSHVSISYAV